MPSRPNILLVMTDQRCVDTIGTLGNPRIRTPALDRLVREGIAFANAYVPSPVCISARRYMAIGLGTHVIGVTDSTSRVVPNASLMERLATTGYQCHGVDISGRDAGIPFIEQIVSPPRPSPWAHMPDRKRRLHSTSSPPMRTAR